MQVDIWSDIVCPWCAIGKARFEQALAQFPHRDDVTVRWRSFELDPGGQTTAEGSYVGRLAAKYGTSTAKAQQMIDGVAAQARAEGLAFRFDIARPAHTFDAHRLLHLADARGRQEDLLERLITAHFSEGAAVDDAATLQRLATEAGLDEVEVKEVLAGDAYAPAVRADEQQAAAYGIRGVPFFVLDGRLGVSGAQPASVLRQALDEAWAAAPPLSMVGSAGQATSAGGNTDDCADGSCEV